MAPILWSVLAALLLAQPAAAQDKKDAAVRRLQQLNQKLSAEKSALERDQAQLVREKAELEQARDALGADLARQKGAAGRQAREAARLAEEATKLRAELAATAQREAALKAELATNAAALQAAQRNGEQLARRLGNQGDTSRHWIAKTESCESKNVQLLELNGELLERYRAKTCADAMAEEEPFTGIARVRLENLLQEYRDRLARERFRAADAPAEKAP